MLAKEVKVDLSSLAAKGHVLPGGDTTNVGATAA